MDQTCDGPCLGVYQLIRPLDAASLGERWLALHERSSSTHVVHRLAAFGDRIERRRFLDAMQRLSRISHPHLLEVEEYCFDASGRACVVTPFTGSVDGLVTLASLMASRGGPMPPSEVERVARQVLSAIEAAHRSGWRHGPITGDDVLVDRRGSLRIELYGVRRCLREGVATTSEQGRDEVRSLVSLAYVLLTGLSAEEPRIAPGRLVPGLEAFWDGWFETGLDGVSGFASASRALERLGSGSEHAGVGGGTRRVRSALGRVGQRLLRSTRPTG